MAIRRRHEMSPQPILFCEVFDVWGIDFMGPFPVSNGYSYILLAVKFGVPKALISDQGSHFCNRAMSSLLEKYGVERRKLQLQELEELCLEAYENSRMYKQNVKQFHDRQILRKEFQVGQKVLLFNSRVKLIAGKLRSRWDGPFVITNVFPYSIVVLKDEVTNSTFQHKCGGDNRRHCESGTFGERAVW
ncbi:hypothetical protein CR513_13394, partial [Mucuna pruriens]